MGAFTGPGFNSRRLHKTFKPPVKYLQGVFVTWKQSLSASNILPLRTPMDFLKSSTANPNLFLPVTTFPYICRSF